MQEQAYDTLLSGRGLSREELYKTLMIDPEFYSCAEEIRGRLIGRSWKIWGENLNEESVNFLHTQIEAFIPQLADMALTARFLGYSVSEYIFEQLEDKSIRIKEYILRFNELSKFNIIKNELVYTASGELILDTKLKFLLLKSRADSQNQKGDPLAIRAYDAVQLKKRGLPYIWQFVRRYAQPYTILKTDSNEKQETTESLSQFAHGGVASIGIEEDLSIHSLNHNGDGFLNIKKDCNAEIQKIVLGRVKTAELSHGAYSAQEIENESAHSRIDDYLNLMQQAGQHLLNAIVELNNQFGRQFNHKNPIYFEFEKVKTLNKERAERDAILVEKLGIELTEQYFLDNYGLEKKHFKINPNKKSAPKEKLSLLIEKLSAPQNVENKKEQKNNHKIPLSENMEAILSVLSQAEDFNQFSALLEETELPIEEIENLFYEGLNENYQLGLNEVEDE